MNIFINGEKETISEIKNLEDLIKAMSVDPSVVVVEHNRSIIKRDELGRVEVAEGDNIEIVRFVGGG